MIELAREIRYVKSYGFLLFARKLGEKCGLIDIGPKTGIDPLKAASKRTIKTATRGTSDLIGNKTTNKFPELDLKHQKLLTKCLKNFMKSLKYLQR